MTEDNKIVTLPDGTRWYCGEQDFRTIRKNFFYGETKITPRDEYEINWADMAADEMAHAVNVAAINEKLDASIADMARDVRYCAMAASGFALALALMILSVSCAHQPPGGDLYRAVCMEQGACK